MQKRWRVTSIECIKLSSDRQENTYGHEIGHALGFKHSVAPIPIDIMCEDFCYDGGGDVQSWHIRKLLVAYRYYPYFP